MKNFLQEGDTLDLIAPGGGVVSGNPVLIGSILAVPSADAAAGDVFAGVVEGVFKLAKSTAGGTAITAGAKVWWDNSAKVVTKTPGANKLAGICVEACADGDATAKIAIDGCCGIYGDEAAAAAAVAAAVATSNVGAGDAAKLVKLDGAGKICGRVIETDGATLDALATGAAAAVRKTDFNAQTVLVAVADDTPLPVTMPAGTILARGTSGNIVALAPAVTLSATPPTIDDSTTVTVPAANVAGRKVFGCVTLTAKIANAAIFNAKVETAPASGVYKTVNVCKQDAGADVINSHTYGFWVAPGCRYKFAKVVPGSAAVDFGTDGYNYFDL